MTALVLGPVEGLDGAVILGPCVLGHPARTDVGPLVLGEGVVIRAYAVLYAGTTIGAGTQIGHGALVREGNEIADEASLGSGASLEPGNRVGARSRIHTGCFIASTSIGSDVFVGPNVTFTDDPHPPCPEYLGCVGGATVEDGASIGANSTILPGVRIGSRSLVGAGSVVTRDVPDGRVVAGSPATDRGSRDAMSCPPGHFPVAYAWVEDPVVR